MDEIYKKYSKTVYNYLCCLTKNACIAEELTQETFYSAIKNIKSFRNDCSISVWLCQIAKNKWYKELRSQKRRNNIPLENCIESLLSEKNLEYDFILKEETIELYEKIHKLDEKTREVFYLRIQGELSFKEIGKIMNRSEEWARVTFYRGKIKIKEDYKNDK